MVHKDSLGGPRVPLPPPQACPSLHLGDRRGGQATPGESSSHVLVSTCRGDSGQTSLSKPLISQLKMGKVCWETPGGRGPRGVAAGLGGRERPQPKGTTSAWREGSPRVAGRAFSELRLSVQRPSHFSGLPWSHLGAASSPKQCGRAGPGAGLRPPVSSPCQEAAGIIQKVRVCFG